MIQKFPYSLGYAQSFSIKASLKVFNLFSIFVIMLLASLAGCKKDNFDGEVKGICPVVISTVPLDKAVDVNYDQVISATFNTEMEASSINELTFTVKKDNIAIDGLVAATSNPKVFTFTPSQELAPFETYTGTVTVGAVDSFNTALEKDYVWTFTTIPQVTLLSAPTIGGTTSGAGNFAQGSTVTVIAIPNSGYVFTNWTANGTVVSNSTTYSFTMNGNQTFVANFTQVQAGNFSVFVSSNPPAGGTTTGNGSYTPNSLVTVTATSNAGYAFTNFTENGIVVSSNPTYSFNITNNRILTANFTFSSSGGFVVNVSSNPLNAGFTTGQGSYPDRSSVTISANANTGFTFTNFTENGNIVSSNNPYTFTLTGNRNLVANFSSSTGLGPQAINLGSAKDFVTLTKSGISTTGITSIIGNIGVSPAAAAAITGFGLILESNGQSSITPIVSGKVYASNYAAPTPAKLTTAVSDMETAFTNGNNLTTPAPIVGLYAGDISGRTMPAGLYKWGTGVLITNAGVTLSGGPNDVWVFQIAQDLTVNSNAQIRLVGGAQAKNIFWVVSGQATIGSNANFSGIILSKTLISLNTGSRVSGRLYAQTAVTLNACTVTQTP